MEVGAAVFKFIGAETPGVIHGHKRSSRDSVFADIYINICFECMFDSNACCFDSKSLPQPNKYRFCIKKECMLPLNP